MDTWGNLSNLWIPCVYLSDQGIPVEYELDKFNTPHTGTTLFNPLNWLCRWWCLILFRHLALTSPLGNINGDTHASPQIHQTHKTHGDSKVYFLQWQTRLLLNYGEHNPLHVRRYALLSQLFRISISCPYIFPFPRDLQHKSKLYFPCCK